MSMRAVFTYHAIDRTGSPISVTPEAFRSQIEWLAESGIAVVELAAIRSLPAHADAIALTFDDALLSMGAVAAPLIAAHGFPATVFVASAHVGRDNRWRAAGDPGVPPEGVLDWDALGRLRLQGFTIGAHSRTHCHLPQCTQAELEDELAGSAEEIARNLGERPGTFAYPYGSVTAEVASAAAAEFDLACTTRFGLLHEDTRRELVPRLDAWYFGDAGRLRQWGSRSFARWVAARHALRRARRMLP